MTEKMASREFITQARDFADKIVELLPDGPVSEEQMLVHTVGTKIAFDIMNASYTQLTGKEVNIELKFGKDT